MGPYVNVLVTIAAYVTSLPILHKMQIFVVTRIEMDYEQRPPPEAAAPSLSSGCHQPTDVCMSP